MSVDITNSAEATAAEVVPLRATVEADATASDTTAEGPLPPLDDPFYLPPPDLAALTPGTVIRSREVELGLLGVVPQRISAWQLLYRTTSVHGTPEAVVTTVLLPEHAEPGERRPLVSYQCAIDAVVAKGLPSYNLRQGARAFGSVPQLELFLFANALARGWVLSVPDHVGTDGHFGVPREPGYRILDGIRAALSFEPLGLTERTPVALWGYSGGGLATTWAAEMAGEYAPELDIVGASAGSPVGDPRSVFARLNGTVYAGLIVLVLSALCRAYPDLRAAVRAHFDGPFHELIAHAESSTILPIVFRSLRRDLDRHSAVTVAELITRPEFEAIFEALRPVTSAPAFPMLVVQATNDAVVAVEDMDEQVWRYRAAGASVQYVRDRLSGHVTLAVIAAPLVTEWLADRLAGKPLPPSAPKTVWSLAFSSGALAGYRRLLGVAGRVLTGRPLSDGQ
ncbi:lipase [Nocardia otitidiscaviarum]|uniref:Lipase n=1 Tax=Nocardia otitidiscaviarum TaxID=1823 RepID=A0A516NHV4_9NOCA|nr:lipase family protein [Nocardia otitidiscaviarum]MCP9618678.1 lipase family protein [Nocardia otitidiscaviarum]QDP78470.1 lipase [Nocardia otitidiscaviarum]